MTIPEHDDSDDLLANLIEAFPPVGKWTPEGRRTIGFRTREISSAQFVQVNIESEKPILECETYYKITGISRYPFVLTVFCKPNYLDLVIDEEKSGFGRCGIPIDDAATETEGFANLYLNDVAFRGFGKTITETKKDDSLFIQMVLFRISEDESMTLSRVTSYRLQRIREIDRDFFLHEE